MGALYIPISMITLGILLLSKGGHLILSLLQETNGYRSHWIAYLSLIVVFILCYLGAIYYGVYIDPHCLNYFYASVFLLGGFYVYLSCHLLTKTIKKTELVDDLTSRFETLKHRSKHDGLTQCTTREYLFEVLNARFQELKRRGGMVVILFIDMDGFKAINDGYGHDVGDVVLHNFARLLRQRLRKNDMAARYGGDEFIVVLENITLDEAYTIAQEIVQIAPLAYKGKELSVGCSIGLSLLTPESSSINKVIKEADIACYAAKQDKTNGSVCLYTPSLEK